MKFSDLTEFGKQKQNVFANKMKSAVWQKTKPWWPEIKNQSSHGWGKLWKVLLDFDPATTRKPNIAFFRSWARAEPINKEISSVMRSLNIFKTDHFNYIFVSS